MGFISEVEDISKKGVLLGFGDLGMETNAFC
jgi:hypothetical protein